MALEPHTMVRLATGKTTCNCGTIHASSDDRDVFIHIEWALREQIKEQCGEIGLLRSVVRKNKGSFGQPHWLDDAERSAYERAVHA